MQELFKHVKCMFNKPVRLACLDENCKLSPFVCSSSCDCYWQHRGSCQIKDIDQLAGDIVRVLCFEFLVMYSPILKSKSIDVIGRYAQQTSSRSKNQQFALTYDSISIKENLNEIHFRLKSIKGCVGVGIFVKQTMVKNNFKYLPDNKYLNHGAFMLLSNSYMFSSSYQQQNCFESKKMNLKQNDVIYVKLVNSDKKQQKNDKNEYKIVFCHQRTGQKQYLTLDWREELTYHFGVYLYDQGDSVQILNKRISRNSS